MPESNKRPKTIIRNKIVDLDTLKGLVPYNKFIRDIYDNSDDLMLRLRVCFMNNYELSVIRIRDTPLSESIFQQLNKIREKEDMSIRAESILNDPTLNPNSEFFEIAVFTPQGEMIQNIRRIREEGIIEIAKHLAVNDIDWFRRR